MNSHLALTLDSNTIGVPFEKDRSGIGAQRSANGLRIIHVASGSPAADIGLRAGDEIIAIDDHFVDDDYLRRHPAMGSRPSGTAIKLALADGRTFILELRDYF